MHGRAIVRSTFFVAALIVFDACKYVLRGESVISPEFAFSLRLYRIGRAHYGNLGV